MCVSSGKKKDKTDKEGRTKGSKEVKAPKSLLGAVCILHKKKNQRLFAGDILILPPRPQYCSTALRVFVCSLVLSGPKHLTFFLALDRLDSFEAAQCIYLSTHTSVRFCSRASPLVDCQNHALESLFFSFLSLSLLKRHSLRRLTP